MTARALAVAASMMLAAPALAAGQDSQPTDPIRCWWTTSAGAVAVGEPFDAALTCAVREQETTRTVPDETRLAAAVIDLAPFEVVGGAHPADLRSPSHRFFQYVYTLRLIDPDAIGRDARVPDIRIGYRVHTRVDGEWVAGREREYVVTGEPVRVLSLVPDGVRDIRDGTGAPFERVAALRFRSQALRVTAYALVAVGLLVAVPALVTLMRKTPAAAAGARGRIPTRAALNAALRELREIDHARRGGWTPDLAARALRALRVAAACAVNGELVQRPAAGTAPASLVVARGLWPRRRFEISSAVTTNEVRKAAASVPDSSASRRQALEHLAEAMAALTGALYRRQFDDGLEAVDHTWPRGVAAASQLRRRR